MRYTYIIVVFLLGCKSKSNLYNSVSSFSINNINKHRNFQDSVLDVNKTTITSCYSLIDSYKELDYNGVIEKSNYYYYLGRLYSKLLDNHVYTNYDSAKNVLNDTSLYIKLKDTMYSYIDISLKENTKNINVMALLAMSLYYEQERYTLSPKSFPIFFKSSLESSNTRLKLVLRDANSFISIDTSLKKDFARVINEVAVYFFEMFTTGKEFDTSKNIDLFNLYKKSFDFLNNYSTHNVYPINKSHFIKEISPVLDSLQIVEKSNREKRSLAEKEINDKEIIRFQQNCLLQGDFVYPNLRNPISAFKFLTDGTFSFSSSSPYTYSDWGRFKIVKPGQIELYYNNTTRQGYDFPKDKLIYLLECNQLVLGSTTYTKH